MTVRFQFDGEVPPAHDAATVLVARDAPGGFEVFLLRRSAAAGFMGGAYVFPGGRVDPGDADPAVPCDLSPEEAAARLGEPDPRLAMALHVAAIRECVEESGILLATPGLAEDALAALRRALAVRGAPPIADVLPAGVTLRATGLRALDRWITPRVESRRFDARFFAARAPGSAEGASHDGSETVASEWMTPADALARASRREIILAPPTWRVLAEAARFETLDALLAAAPPRPPPREPVVLTKGDEIQIALPDDPEHPEFSGAPSPPENPLPTRFRYEAGAWIPVR